MISSLVSNIVDLSSKDETLNALVLSAYKYRIREWLNKNYFENVMNS